MKEKQANKIGALRACFDGVDLGPFLAQRFAGAVRGRLRLTTVSLLRPALRPSSLLGDLRWWRWSSLLLRWCLRSALRCCCSAVGRGLSPLVLVR